MSPWRRTTNQPTSEYRATQSVLDWVSQLCQGSFTMAAWARCFLLPDTVRKAWQMCTGTRSWWWWWQTLMRKHNRHVMEDFQWKVWKYFNNSCFLRIRVVITMTDLSSLHRGQWQWWRWRRWRHQWWAPRNAYSRTDPPLDEDNLRYESCILCIYQCDCNAK